MYRPPGSSTIPVVLRCRNMLTTFRDDICLNIHSNTNVKSHGRQRRRLKVHSDTKISHAYFWKKQYNVMLVRRDCSIAFMLKLVSICASNEVSEPATAYLRRKTAQNSYYYESVLQDQTPVPLEIVICTIKTTQTPAPWPVQVWQTSEMPTEM